MVILLCWRNKIVNTFLFFVLCLSIKATAQTGYAVVYKRDDVFLPMTIQGEKRRIPLPDNLLVFSDSLSLYHFVSGGNPIKKKRLFGEKLIHHAMLFNKNTDTVYSEVNWPPGKNKYLIADTSIKYDWKFPNSTKLVLGYQCKPALYVNTKNDSVLLWFTTEIAEPFGPANYIGLPGLVLEVYDQRNGLHIFADKLVKDNFKVVFPKEGRVLSKEEYWEIRPKKSKGK
jgi:GLPGLI family protein